MALHQGLDPREIALADGRRRALLVGMAQLGGIDQRMVGPQQAPDTKDKQRDAQRGSQRRQEGLCRERLLERRLDQAQELVERILRRRLAAQHRQPVRDVAGGPFHCFFVFLVLSCIPLYFFLYFPYISLYFSLYCFCLYSLCSLFSSLYFLFFNFSSPLRHNRRAISRYIPAR